MIFRWKILEVIIISSIALLVIIGIMEEETLLIYCSIIGMKTLMEILLKWITPKRDAAEMNNYRRSQQIHFDDLLK